MHDFATANAVALTLIALLQFTILMHKQGLDTNNYKCYALILNIYKQIKDKSKKTIFDKLLMVLFDK